MASELKRGIIRALSNYSRFLFFLILGILFVPIVIIGVGDEGFGLLGLLGSTIGIAELCNAVVRDSMNRELGAAYHSSDPDEFPATYNAAIVLTTMLAVVTALIFAAFALLLPLFNISDELRSAALWLLLAKGVYSVLVVLLGPQFNMYLVTERMVLFNTWIIGGRVSEFLAALILFVFLGMRDPATGLTAFAFLSAGGNILVLFIAVGIIMSIEPSLKPSFSRVRWSNVKRVVSTAGWNGATVLATNMHMRLDNIIMNLGFGLMHNAAFVLALRLTSYVRILAFANTQGLDVVSARISTRESQARVAEILRQVTRVHAMVAIPAGMIVMLLAPPLLNLWVGRATDNPDTIRMAIVLSQILVIGMTARGISDCWTRMLYGAGFIRAYAPLVLAGGLLNPIVAVSLIVVLPSTINYMGPAIAFASIFLIVHFMIIPFIAARCLEIAPGQIFLPVLRPAITAAITSPLLLLPRIIGQPDSVIALLIAVAMFGAATFVIAWFFVLSEDDRLRLVNAVKRRLGKGQRDRKPEADDVAVPLESDRGTPIED